MADDPTQPTEPRTDLRTGLSAQEVAHRLRAVGYNEVPEAKDSALLRFARKFWGVTPWMLELTAALTWVLDRAIETYVVLALLLMNGILGFYQENRASQAVATLRKRLAVNARVLRGGAWSSVPSRELVPGDAVRLRKGDLVPADVRVREGKVEVDQSALTGESLPVERAEGDLLVSGSTVTQGEATGQVAATGAKTYYGRTVELVQLARPKLHMEEVVASVVRWLILMVGAFLALAVAIGALRGQDVVQILPLAVVLLVSAIPVALPTMFAISMALGSLDLAAKGVLVTRLSAGEDAAAMDVLCADKTGTLTMNRLSVAEVVPLDGFSEADVLRYAALASQEANQDPIDLAVLAAARAQGALPDGWSVRRFVPFDAATRRTEAVAVRGGSAALVRKGAISAVLPAEADRGVRARVVKEVDRLSAKGCRSLAVAVGPDEAGLRPAGILGLSDLPRPDTAHQIQELGKLGVSVKMLTGDALPIARATAEAVGLGDDIARIADLREDLKQGRAVDAVEKARGFAEIYPEDKYLVVKALQDARHVVGMTGDGVNDAPALSQAEVGIAVSDATDVAKKSASVVLTREGLGGIVDLVTSGRRIYQRIVTWILNKIVKTFQIVVFVVLAYLLTGQYVVSVFSMILFLFVTDFVTLALSTDTVRPSPTPDTWDIATLAKVSVALGLAIVAESFLLLYVADRAFGFASDTTGLQTFVFDYLVFLGVLDVLILRERRRFWESRPSRTLVAAVLLDILIVASLSAVGFFTLAPIAPVEILAVLGFSAGTAFLVNDALKVVLVRKLWSWA